MKTEQKETKLISEGELSLLIDDEFSNTMLVHKQLLHQCGKLADAMGCTSPYIIKNIMPSASIQGTNIAKVEEWFNKRKKVAIAQILEAQEAEEDNRKRNDLLNSLNLTIEQMHLLGFYEA